MTHLLIFLIAIFFWQVVMIILYNLDIDDDTRDVIFCWMVVPFVLGLRWLLNKYLLFRFRNYNQYQFFGGSGGYDSWVGNYWMTPEFASQFNLVDPVVGVETPYSPPESYCVRMLRTMEGRKEPPWKADIFCKAHTPNVFRDEEFLNKFKKRA